MIALARASAVPKGYARKTALADLSTVANGNRLVARKAIDEAGNHIAAAKKEHMVPLMRGAVGIAVAPERLPAYLRLR